MKGLSLSILLSAQRAAAKPYGMKCIILSFNHAAWQDFSDELKGSSATQPRVRRVKVQICMSGELYGGWGWWWWWGGYLSIWHTHEDTSRIKQRHKSTCIWMRQTTGTQTETVRGNKGTQTSIWKYVKRLHLFLQVQMGHSASADSSWKITDRPLQTTYTVGKDEKQIEAAHTVKRKPVIGRRKTKRGSLQDSSAGPEPAGAREKCDVSWDEITLKAKAEVLFGLWWCSYTSVQSGSTPLGKQWNYHSLWYLIHCDLLSSTLGVAYNVILARYSLSIVN